MTQLQLARLKHQLERAYERIPMYRKRYDEAGFSPGDVKDIGEIAKLPFTEKDDLRAHYPFGMFAEPLDRVARLHASSGTTGKATVVGYTQEDLEDWAECVARLCMMAGAVPGDMAQIAFGYGLFTGALGLHYGLEKLGATVVPVSSGNTERQIQLMRDFETTLLISTPSYALYLAEAAEKMGVLPQLKLRLGLFGGEGLSDAMRAALEKRFRISATENYGLSEVMGPGVSGECACKQGMHINEDHFLCEIIDPDTLEVLPMGETGELVITTLTKRANPVIRYRTRDITRLLKEPCACGRTLIRMAKCQGRSDDMLIIRGVNLFPSQIEEVLVGVEGIGPHYEILVTRAGYLDQIEVQVELADGRLLGSHHELEALRARVASKLRSVCQVDIKVKLASPNTLKRFEGKAKRVTDLRA